MQCLIKLRARTFKAHKSNLEINRNQTLLSLRLSLSCYSTGVSNELKITYTASSMNNSEHS